MLRIVEAIVLSLTLLMTGQAGAQSKRESASRLTIAANVRGATVRIDGGKRRKLPLSFAAAPGRHLVEVQAPGYIADVRDVVLRPGQLRALAVTLEPRPAKLAIDGPVEALVHVDGKFVGALPGDPIDVTAGEHTLTVSMRGHHTHTQQIEAKRSRWLAVEVDLERTEQRKGALALIVLGSGGIVAAIVCGVLAVMRNNEAVDIGEGSPDPAEASRYDATIAERDDFRLGSGLSAAGGFAMFIAGSVLFVVDNPAAPAVPGDVSFAPTVGPGIAGGSATLSF